MEQSKNTNRGYVIPDKGKGRLDVDGKDTFLVSHWTNENKLHIEFSEEKGKGKGYMSPNEHKNVDRQPDWRGKFTSSSGKDWLVSGWNRDRNGDTLISVALTDPDTRPQRRQEPAQAPSTAQTPTAQPPVTQSPATQASPPPVSQPAAGVPAQAPSTTPDGQTPGVGAPDEYNLEWGDIFGGNAH